MQVGVVAYTLLCGYEPFYGVTDKQLISANKLAEYEFHDPEWTRISAEAKDLVRVPVCPVRVRYPSVRMQHVCQAHARRLPTFSTCQVSRMLVRVPADRITPAEALQHPWLRRFNYEAGDSAGRWPACVLSMAERNVPLTHSPTYLRNLCMICPQQACRRRRRLRQEGLWRARQTCLGGRAVVRQSPHKCRVY
jgi:serine/threonine protein kinase